MDETLPQLIKRLWGGRIIIGFGCGIGFIIAIILSLLLKPQYQATMIVAPFENNKDVIDFIGITNTIASNDKLDANFIRFEQSLRGNRVATVIAQMNDVLGNLKQDTMFRGMSIKFDNASDITAYLEQQIDIEPIGETDSIKITYRHPDPEFVAKFLNLITKIDDKLIKNQDKEQTLNRISWLKESLKTSFNPDHRQAIAKMLMTEERRLMLLSTGEFYALQIIEDAATRARRVVPSTFKYIIALVFWGGTCGAIIVAMRGK